MSMKYVFPLLTITLLSSVTVLTLADQKPVVAENSPAQTMVASVSKMTEAGTVTFSPNGTQYLVQQNQTLYVVKNGEVKRLADQVARGEWKNDNTIVFTSNPEGESGSESPLWEIDIRTNVKKQIGKTDNAFRLFTTKSGKVIITQKNKIKSVHAELDQLATLAEIEADDYRISPDENLLAFVKGNDLFILNFDSGEKYQITNMMELHHWDDFAWSADSNKLLFATNDQHNASLNVFDVNTRISSSLYKVSNSLIAGVNWLKNGDVIYQVIPMRDTEASYHARYEVLNPTTRVHQILFENGLGLRLAPDGKKFTFMRQSNGTESSYVAELIY